MRRECDHSASRELPNELGDEDDPVSIEVGIGFIEQKDRRISAEETGERDALAFANRERIDPRFERLDPLAMEDGE